MISVSWGRDVQWRSPQNKLLFIKIRLQKGLSKTLVQNFVSAQVRDQEPFRNKAKEMR